MMAEVSNLNFFLGGGEILVYHSQFNKIISILVDKFNYVFYLYASIGAATHSVPSLT